MILLSKFCKVIGGGVVIIIFKIFFIINILK
jgi:hypothetical protein